MEKEIGQLFFIGLSGTTLTNEERDFIVNNNIGGVTLFGRNVESPEQVYNLCSDLHNLKSEMNNIPLAIGIDMEGGRVHRLKPPFTKWPAARKLGDLDSTSLAFKFALGMGEELRAIGINLNFAPCVDIFTNPKNTVIGDRSFGTNPEIVAKMASAITRGYIKAGVMPCAKHFPGHGNTLVDSHDDLPIEETSMEQLEERELIPFKKAFRARMDFVMTSHILFKNIDPDHPVTLSKKIITDKLRNELRYKNIVITDDLDMGALSKNYSTEEIPVRALQAGCDILLYCNKPEVPPIAINAVKEALANGDISEEQVKNSIQKIVDIKSKKMNIEMPTLDDALSIINNEEHQKIAEAISTGNVPEEFKTT